MSHRSRQRHARFSAIGFSIARLCCQGWVLAALVLHVVADDATDTAKQDAAPATANADGAANAGGNTNCDSKVSSLEANVASAEKATQQCQGEKDGVAREKDALAQQLATSQTDAKTCADEKSRLSDDLKTFSDEKSRVYDELKAKTEEASRVADELSKSRETASQCQSDVAAKSADIDTKAAEISGLQSQVSDLQGKVSGLEAAVATKTDENKQLTADGDATRSKLGDTEQQFSALQEKHHALEADRDRVAALYEALQKERDNLRGDHDNLTGEHVKLQKKYKRVSERYADPSLQHFLRAKAIKVYSHPGIGGAANKTYVYVLPTLKAQKEKGKHWLNETEAALYNRLNAYVGTYGGDRPWLPFIHGFIVYGLVGLPLLCTVWCLMRIICRLRPCLIFGHLYMGLSFLWAAAFAFYTQIDPLKAFAVHDPALYLFSQLVFGLILAVYLVLLLLMTCASQCQPWREKLLRIVQLFAAVPIVAAYYVIVWTPAMQDQQPRVTQFLTDVAGASLTETLLGVPYLYAGLTFMGMLRLEQLSWRQAPPSKKDDCDKLSIAIRDDVELRGAEELSSLIGASTSKVSVD